MNGGCGYFFWLLVSLIVLKAAQALERLWRSPAPVVEDLPRTERMRVAARTRRPTRAQPRKEREPPPPPPEVSTFVVLPTGKVVRVLAVAESAEGWQVTYWPTGGRKPIKILASETKPEHIHTEEL